MMAVQKRWSDVEALMYVQDKTGKAWRVEAAGTQQVRLVDAEGDERKIRRPPPGLPVVVLEPTEAEAFRLVAKKLGPVAMSWPQRIDELRSHLYLLHGYAMPKSVTDRAKPMAQFHVEDHRDEHLRQPLYVHHNHEEIT